MKTYTSEELHEILTQHKQWLNSEENGKRADLGYADLGYANLRGADLRDADLRGTLGNLKHIKSLQCEKYYVAYTSSSLQIGCQKHTIEDWEAFDNEKIKGMDVGALEWWTKWKPIIMQIIEMSPAEPTGVKNE